MERLPHGGFRLQATERFDDHGQREAAAVFEVLRPFLPEGAVASNFADAGEPILRWVPEEDDAGDA